MGKVWKRRLLLERTAETLAETTATVETIIETVAETKKVTTRRKPATKKGSTNASKAD